MSDTEETDDELINIAYSMLNYYYNRPSANDAVENEPEETQAESTQEVRQFDTNLPTTHKYLGKLNNVSGYTFFDHGEIVTLLAIHTNTMVFPGFILPLVLNSEMERNVMQNFISKTNMFVLICADESGSEFFPYGVTMEVLESSISHDSLSLKAKGRQRCKILPEREMKHQAGRLRLVTVKILAEPAISSPINNSQLLALKTRKKFVCANFDEVISSYKHRRYHLSQYPHASWVYDHNEICFYVKIMLDSLAAYFIRECIPNDPISLSYWFVQNFQLTHQERLQLLSLNSTIERLRLELKLLKLERVLCCAFCRGDVAKQNDIFAMSKEGVQSNYCNPGGHVYETVTVTKAKNYKAVGPPSYQFSWFPGYAWTIMQCFRCECHLGWRFTSKNLQPRSFFGLAKGGFEVKIISGNDAE